MSSLERRDVAAKWGAVGGNCNIRLPPPDPFPDLLQCLNISIVSAATCRAVYPGRITDNMVCAGGVPGEDACQVMHGHPRQAVGDREEERGGGVSQKKEVREKAEVRKKGRHRMKEGERAGRRARGWRTKRGRVGRERRGRWGRARAKHQPAGPLELR